VSLKKYKNIFWDFDGVIKDSVDVKSEAFLNLFHGIDLNLKKKIEDHHLNNSGISRYKKIPLYLEWAEIDKSYLTNYLDTFEKDVITRVIKSNWVMGAKEYLSSNPYQQKFFLVTATPQKEIEFILKKLNIFKVFSSIFGSPVEKSLAVKKIIFDNKLLKRECIFFGDALTDYNASVENGITFLLRMHEHNKEIFKNISLDYKVKDFINYEQI
jgi:phosphoglycolate phosphatase-like HAD superfamily hydrolase